MQHNTSKQYIEITNEKTCSGCRACESICPMHCISMVSDSLGLKYPLVEISQCIKCGKCIKVCPFRNEYQNKPELECFAGINQNLTEREKSSSGGIFLSLAKKVILQKGVVFGAIFNDDWIVRHQSGTSLTEVQKMMGSKYVQSDTTTSFSEVKKYLTEGRKVLYSGTPCQIAGLSHYLQKDYDNLLLVEVICHGTPAPAIWTSYLTETFDRYCKSGSRTKDQNCILSIDFRDKRNGWKNFGLNFLYEDQPSNEIEFYQLFYENDYMQAFLNNWSLRPSCYDCKTKSGKSGADITIGDFWGIENLDHIKNDDKGISCIVCRTEKGLNAIKDCSEIKLKKVSYSSILKDNISIEKSVTETSQAIYFKGIFNKKGFYQALYKTQNPTLLHRLIIRLKKFV